MPNSAHVKISSAIHLGIDQHFLLGCAGPQTSMYHMHAVHAVTIVPALPGVKNEGSKPPVFSLKFSEASATAHG